MKLLSKHISSAKPKDKPYKLSDGNGLYLHVSAAGKKSWKYNYRLQNKYTTKTYGDYPQISLAGARKFHAEFLESANKLGENLFKDVAKDWLKIKLPSLSNPKHQLQVCNTINKYVFPHIGNMPMNDIKRTNIVQAVQSVAALGITETAHRVAGRITAVFNYAQDCGIIESNPAQGLSRVITAKKRQKPMTCIDVSEAGQLLKDIQSYQDEVTKLALLMLAHTFLRSTELRLLKWSEINRQDKIILISEERMKLRKPHVVPLSFQVLSILDQLHAINSDSDFVFQSPLKRDSAISENTLLFALYRLGYRGKMTGHGFRSLASTVLNQQSPFSSDVIERQLAHKETDAVRAAYNRADYLPQRRELMQWYSDWLDSQLL